MARIGFIGLGHMGLPMAMHLVQAGHLVTGFDLAPDALNAFQQAGGMPGLSLQQTAHNQDVLITMLQSGQQVRDVCLDEQGLFAKARPQSLFIDCSSIDITSSRELHQQATDRGLMVVDAPVSGGVNGAIAGTLTFMVGGSKDAFEHAQPILSCMGKTLIHTGEAGSGQAAKLCNNMILGITMIAVSEAFTLAEQVGLSPQKLHEVVSHSSGNCWTMAHYVPVSGILDNVPANHDYKPGFTVAMMLKDLRLSQHAAQTVGTTTMLGALATQLYQQFNDTGHAELDFSAIIQAIDSTPQSVHQPHHGSTMKTIER